MKLVRNGPKKELFVPSRQLLCNICFPVEFASSPSHLNPSDSCRAGRVSILQRQWRTTFNERWSLWTRYIIACISKGLIALKSVSVSEGHLSSSHPYFAIIPAGICDKMSFTVQSKACCTRPPIVLRGGYDYEEKGQYVDFNGMKTCEEKRPISMELCDD